MKQIFSLVALFFFAAFPSQAFSQQGRQVGGKILRANIVGTVLDNQGHSVEGVEISAQDPDGEVVARAVTDREGKYTMKCLKRRQYNLTLNPLMTDFQGQTVTASLGLRGLIADWTTSATALAIAKVRSGGGTCGAAAMGLGGLGLIGGGVGGAFHDPPGDGGPVSPAQ